MREIAILIFAVVGLVSLAGILTGFLRWLLELDARISVLEKGTKTKQ